LNTIHNVRYFMNLMVGIRAAVREGRFTEFRREFHRRHAREREDEACRYSAADETE